MPGTIGDFWQMIWDQKVQTIVMLTKLMEGNKPKCEQYWPSKTGESTNPKPSLQVTFVQAQTFADYEIRVLQVKSVRIFYIQYRFTYTNTCLNRPLILTRFHWR